MKVERQRVAPEVAGGELAAKEAGRGADGLLDDPGALGNAGYELEGAVAPWVVRSVLSPGQESGDIIGTTFQGSFFACAFVFRSLITIVINLGCC